MNRGNKWWTLGAVCIGMFMLLLDITVVNVALPKIQADLHASFADLQWVVDAYSLSLAGLLLTAGALADLLGRRKLFATGLVVFTLASVLCGLAGTPVVLNFSRALQGVGGAVMFATSLALIAQAFEGRERGTAFGIYGATIGAAVAVGPLVGGAITDSVGWQGIFFVNVPIGIAALAVTLTRVEESSDPEATGIDWGGLVTFSLSLLALVFAIVRGNAEGWTSTLILGLFAAAAVLMILFVAVERRQERPMFDLSLFRNRTFSGASIVAFTLGASQFAMFLYLTLYIQGVLGYAPFDAGLRFLPITLLSFFVAPLAGRLSVRMPVRILLGAGLACVGTGLLLMGGLHAGSAWTSLLAGFVISGIGVGMANAPLVSTAVGVVPPARSGMASGINNTFRQVGVATGIAVLGAILQHQIAQKVTAGLSGMPGLAHRSGMIAEGFASGQGRTIAAQAPASARPRILELFSSSYIGALNHILVLAAIVAFIGAVLGFALVRASDFVAQRPPAA